MKSCLNCKYQPDWEEPVKRGGYTVTNGACKWDKPIPVFPATFELFPKRLIQRYDDDSGIYTNCKAWERE